MRISESDILKNIVEGLKVRYPEALIIRVNSGSFKVGNRFIRCTSFPGISDLVYIDVKSTVFLEVKTKTGKQNLNQKSFQDNCLNKKLNYAIVHSLDDSIEIIEAVRSMS